MSEVGDTLGQDAIEYGGCKVTILVELELCNLACLARRPRARIERQDEHFAGTRHGNVEQTCTLLERCRFVFFAHGDKLARSRIRGAHIIHKLRVKPCRRRRATAEILVEGLLGIGACDKCPVRSAAARKTGGQQRNVGMVCGATHLHARRISVNTVAIRHRDNRELQALRGMHCHDADRRGVALVQSTGSLLARQECIECARDLSRRIAKGVFRILQGVEGLEHIGGDGATPGTTLRQADKPSRGVDHIARDTGKRIATHTCESIAKHLSRATEQAKILKTGCIVIRGNACIQVTAPRLACFGVVRGSESQELLDAEREHRRSKQRHESLGSVCRIRKRADESAHGGHLGRA